MNNQNNSFAASTLDSLYNELKKCHAMLDEHHSKFLDAVATRNETFETYHRLSKKACKVRIDEIYQVIRLIENGIK